LKNYLYIAFGKKIIALFSAFGGSKRIGSQTFVCPLLCNGEPLFAFAKGGD
jgi:hypothetical protein